MLGGGVSGGGTFQRTLPAVCTHNIRTPPELPGTPLYGLILKSKLFLCVLMYQRFEVYREVEGERERATKSFLLGNLQGKLVGYFPVKTERVGNYAKEHSYVTTNVTKCL